MRSKTTMVSCTENPITTSNATMKLMSMNTFSVFPKKANNPAGRTTSWTRVNKVINPYFKDFTGSVTFLKAKIIYKDMPTITNPTAHQALELNSLDTMGLTDQKSNSLASSPKVLFRAPTISWRSVSWSSLRERVKTSLP